jgi:hypothetical protein
VTILEDRALGTAFCATFAPRTPNILFVRAGLPCEQELGHVSTRSAAPVQLPQLGYQITQWLEHDPGTSSWNEFVPVFIQWAAPATDEQLARLRAIHVHITLNVPAHALTAVSLPIADVICLAREPGVIRLDGQEPHKPE